MAGVAGDVVKVALRGTSNAAIFRNIFFYRMRDGGTEGYLTGILTEFQSVVLSALASTMVNTYTYSEVTATNIFSGDEEMDITPVPSTGGRVPSGDYAPTFVAALITLQRSNARVRSGRKFIQVSTEGDIQGNLLSSAFQAVVQTAALTMATPLAPGGTDFFDPIIVGRIAYTTPSGRPAYRLPTSQAEMTDNWSYIKSAAASPRATTMNSRKYWRGE